MQKRILRKIHIGFKEILKQYGILRLSKAKNPGRGTRAQEKSLDGEYILT